MIVVVPNSGKVIENLPFEDYLKLPQVNQSYLKTMIRKSPMHAEMDCGEETEAMKKGTMAHSLLFGEVDPKETWAPFDGIRRGKKWDDFQEECKESGKEPVKRSAYDEVIGMTKAIPAGIKSIVDKAQKEITIVFEVLHVDSGRIIPAKARIDIWPGHAIYDYKTAGRGVGRDEFSKAIANFMYDVQAVWYRFAMQSVTGKELLYYWIAHEPKKPYDIEVYFATPELLANGADWLNHAMEIYCKCLDEDSFPGSYNGTPKPIDAPHWHMYEVDINMDNLEEVTEL